MSRTLLLDADVLAYRSSIAIEQAVEWEPGYWTWHCDENQVRRAILEEIDRTMAKLDGTAFKLCMTDTTNFRTGILPTYKGNRSNVKRPLVLKAIRAWLLEEHEAVMRPSLEGDDVMGILATWPKLRGEKIIISIDKDMKTIPGLYVRALDEPMMEVSGAEADFWHFYQTLTGDSTDGYSGCPGIGPKKAEAILDPYRNDKPHHMWDAVVETYAKAKLGVEEAITQARVARILRASDFNFKTKEPILWTPPNS